MMYTYFKHIYIKKKKKYRFTLDWHKEMFFLSLLKSSLPFTLKNSVAFWGTVYHWQQNKLWQNNCGMSLSSSAMALLKSIS